jgi:phage protein D
MTDGPPLLVGARPVISIDGQEDSALMRDLIRLETRADSNGVDELDAVFLNFGAAEGASSPGFVHFDRGRLDFGKSIAIAFNVGGARETVFDGSINAIGALYPEQRPPELTILAEDQLARLRLKRRSRAFEQSSDADMLNQLVQDAGLRADVQADGPSHTQRLQVGQSELALLRERARALDARITLRDGAVTVTTRSDGARPVTLTRLNELIRFELKADLAEQRSAVRVHGWDIAGKQAITEEAGTDAARAAAEGQGRTGAEIVREAWGEAPEDLHLDAPASTDEARRLAEARMRHRARNFIRGRGITRGTPTLRVGGRVELLDLGAWFSGVWEVTAVRHSFDQAAGYRTEFEACRAALEAGA